MHEFWEKPLPAPERDNESLKLLDDGELEDKVILGDMISRLVKC